MNLPDDLYTRILSALRPEEAPATPEGALAGGATTAGGPEGSGGQRRALRRRVNHPVRFVRHGAPAAVPQEATLLDVSPVGVCILCDSVAAPGEALVVYLPCATRTAAVPANHLARAVPQTVALPCKVRSCRIRSNGMFRVGAEFADPAEGGDPAALVRKADGVASTARVDMLWARRGAETIVDPDAKARRGERTPADGRATIYLYHGDGGAQAPLEQVAVRDFSEHGVAILRGEPLEVGAEFVIRLPRFEDKPITRLCRVANVAPSDGRYRIGAEFVPFPGPFGRGLLGRIRNWIS